MPPKKPATSAPTDRFAVSATNHTTGETWTIHDTREVCEAELNAKLHEWTDGERVVHVTTDGPTAIE